MIREGPETAKIASGVWLHLLYSSRLPETSEEKQRLRGLAAPDLHCWSGLLGPVASGLQCGEREGLFTSAELEAKKDRRRWAPTPF